LKRNIAIAYWLTFCKHSWFWLGIWVFYYLKFTNYAGIGLIETVLIVTMTVTEIPTGAIADLLGKRNTLFVAFLLEAAGGVIMAMAQSLEALMFSVFVMCVGGALYSGTLEALVYDSLKQENEESRFDRVISIIGSLQLIAPAVCGALGGFLYVLSPRLPFWSNAGFYVLGMIATLFIAEPLIDSEKFSLRNYFQQTKQGWHQLTQSPSVRNQALLLLSVGVIVVIMDEMLNGFLAVEFGFKERSIGILWGVIYLVAASASQLTPTLKKRFGLQLAFIMVGGLMALLLLLTPKLGLILGGISLLLGTSFQALTGNFISIAINENTQSRYRATTLSTFNMFKNIPYVLGAYFIGSLADIYSAKWLAFSLGVGLVAFLILQFALPKKHDITHRTT
jgi:MFS family permease